MKTDVYEVSAHPARDILVAERERHGYLMIGTRPDWRYVIVTLSTRKGDFDVSTIEEFNKLSLEHSLNIAEPYREWVVDYLARNNLAAQTCHLLGAE